MATRRLGQLRTSAASDRELVERVRDGDQAALAAIYDRYALRLTDLARAIVGPSGAEDVVHDAFVGAAQRIDQLRDPDKLRPWLYRITRRHALAHLRARRTEPMGLEVTVGDPMVDGPLTEAERDELRRLVDDAAAGLEEKDRVLLHLLYRHELSAEEAGDVLDLRAEQVHARSFRVRDRFARSLGAVVVARHGRGKCVELRELLGDWDGTITPRWRKRISRHLERCDVCSSTKDRVAAPMALLSVAPLVPVAAGMRERTLDAMSDALGFGAFTGDLDLDGDGSDGESSSNPGHNSPSSSQAHHPANQASSTSTSTSTSSTATSSTASSSAPSSVVGGSTSAGASSSGSAAASSSSAAGSVSSSAGAGASSSSSAASLTPTGPTTGWPSGTLAGAGSGSSASSSAAAASVKAGSGAAVPPTPEIVDAPPPPPEIADPGIASTLLDTVKAAVGVGGAIAATTTVPAAMPETTIPEPAGIVVEIDGDEIAVSPLDPIEIEAPATTQASTIIVIEPEVTEVPTESTTTTVPESTTTTTTVPESTTTPTTTTVPGSTTTTTTTTTTVPGSTTTTTVPESTTTSTTVPGTTSTTIEDPLGGSIGAGDGGTGGAGDDEDGETGGAGEESTTTTSTTLP